MYSSNGSDNETDDSGNETDDSDNETDDSDNETDDSSEIFQILLQMWELLPCSHWLWHNQKVFYQSNSGLSEIYVFSPHNSKFFYNPSFSPTHSEMYGFSTQSKFFLHSEMFFQVADQVRRR